MISETKKYIFLTMGWISFALGVIGIALPVMPTAPFMIFSAYCFSKGSERLHAWLLSLPKAGPAIHDWEQHGVIRPRAKIVATIMILMSFVSVTFLAPVEQGVKVLLWGIGLTVLGFIWSRPSSPKGPQQSP